jgi:hypothetical protein
MSGLFGEVFSSLYEIDPATSKGSATNFPSMPTQQTNARNTNNQQTYNNKATRSPESTNTPGSTRSQGSDKPPSSSSNRSSPFSLFGKKNDAKEDVNSLPKKDNKNSSKKIKKFPIEELFKKKINKKIKSIRNEYENKNKKTFIPMFNNFKAETKKEKSDNKIKEKSDNKIKNLNDKINAKIERINAKIEKINAKIKKIDDDKNKKNKTKLEKEKNELEKEKTKLETEKPESTKKEDGLTDESTKKEDKLINEPKKKEDELKPKTDNKLIKVSNDLIKNYIINFLFNYNVDMPTNSAIFWKLYLLLLFLIKEKSSNETPVQASKPSNAALIQAPKPSNAALIQALKPPNAAVKASNPSNATPIQAPKPPNAALKKSNGGTIEQPISSTPSLLLDNIYNLIEIKIIKKTQAIEMTKSSKISKTEHNQEGGILKSDFWEPINSEKVLYININIDSIDDEELKNITEITNIDTKFLNDIKKISTQDSEYFVKILKCPELYKEADGLNLKKFLLLSLIRLIDNEHTNASNSQTKAHASNQLQEKTSTKLQSPDDKPSEQKLTKNNTKN